MTLRFLHQRDFYLRLEFGVAALVVLVLVLASAFSRTIDAAEPTPAQRSLGEVGIRPQEFSTIVI